MSTIIALMCVRNEAWVLRYSLPALLTWVDQAVVLLHACSDASPAIATEVAASHPGRVHILQEPNPEWREMEHRQRMLECARAHGATHIGMVDADEVLAAPLRSDIREITNSLQPRQLLVAPWLNLWRSLDVYRRDRTPHGSGYASLIVRDGFGLCWMAAPDGYQHHHRHPYGTLGEQIVLQGIPGEDGWPGLMHLQRANWRRARARQAWYKAIEALKYRHRRPCAMIDGEYSAALDETDARFHTVPLRWWSGYELDRGLIDLSDGEDWQELELKRLVAEHGRERFAGLDFFGLET